MARASKRLRRLWDTYSFAGFRAQPTVRGIFSDPKARIIRLKRGGLLVGVESDTVYAEGVVKLNQDELVVIYTDGVTDQRNSKGELFGEKRLVDFLRDNLRLSLEDLIEKLFATLLAFGQNYLHDDTTVVLLRKNLG